MDTFKDRLVFLWKNEGQTSKIAADIDMTICRIQPHMERGWTAEVETLKNQAAKRLQYRLAANRRRRAFPSLTFSNRELCNNPAIHSAIQST